METKSYQWGQKIVSCDTTQTPKGANSAAMNALTGVGYKLYSYLVDMATLNDGRDTFPLCWNDVCSYTGMSRQSYWAAVNELISVGYLKLTSKVKRLYSFDGTSGR